MTEEAVPANAAKTSRLVDARGRGTSIEFRGEDEFHACWYPVALSSEVVQGGLIGAPFLDGRAIVYRTSDGVAHVKSAYCRHLGADLSIGRIVNDRVQCPFHFWRYDSTGSCIDVPAGDPPPPYADDGASVLLAQSRDYALRLVNEDAPIFDTLSFRRDNLTASDRFLAFGIQYIRRYPRAHPGRQLIR